MHLLLVLITQKGFVWGLFGASNYARRLGTIQPILGNLENMFPQNWQNKPSRRCWKMVFSCLKHYSNLLLNFPKYTCKVCIHAFLQKTTRNSNKHYTKSPTASTTIISIHALPSSPFWHKFQKQMEATSIYTKLPNYYVTKEITTSS